MSSAKWRPVVAVSTGSPVVNFYQVVCFGVASRALPKLGWTLPAAIPSSDETDGMEAGSGTSLGVRVDRRNWASGVKFQDISTKNSAW